MAPSTGINRSRKIFGDQHPASSLATVIIDSLLIACEHAYGHNHRLRMYMT
jgi:hypothetical protein